MGCSVDFRFGWISDAARSVSDDVSPESEPTRLEEYYDIEREYFTTPSGIARLSFRYTFRSNVYIEARFRSCEPLKALYRNSGRYRFFAGLALGYDF